MGITADRLQQLGLIDRIIEEPLGGSHRDPQKMAETLQETLSTTLSELRQIPINEILQQRYQRLMNYGQYKE